jgi:hypothetical protein
MIEPEQTADVPCSGKLNLTFDHSNASKVRFSLFRYDDE